jgi:hypothetical protein
MNSFLSDLCCQSCRPDGLFVRAVFPFLGCIVIHDPHIHTTVDGGLEGAEHRDVGELVSGHAQAVFFGRVIDEPQASIQEAARQPYRLRVLRIVRMGGRLILECPRERLAGNGSTVEPHAVAIGELFLGADF